MPYVQNNGIKTYDGKIVESSYNFELAELRRQLLTTDVKPVSA